MEGTGSNREDTEVSSVKIEPMDSWDWIREDSVLTKKHVVERYTYISQILEGTKECKIAAVTALVEELMAVWRSLGRNPLPEPLIQMKINQVLRCMETNLSSAALDDVFDISDDANDESSRTLNRLLMFETMLEDREWKTIDHFDINLGLMFNRDSPTSLEFACALLREVLVALTEPSILREKVKLGALILHLTNATSQFDWLYHYYHQIESDVLAGETDWFTYQTDLEIEEKLVNQATEGNYVFDSSVLSYKEAALLSMKVEEDTKLESHDQDLTNGDDFNPSDDFHHSDDDYRAAEPDIKKRTVGRKKKEKVESSERKVPKKRGPKKKEKIIGPNTEICEVCKFVASCGRTLSVHMFEEHSHGSLCTQCGHPSKTYKEYEQHMSTHSLSCDQCSFTTVGLKRLRRHQKTHKTDLKTEKGGDSNMTKIPCYICGKELIEASLEGHVANMHKDALLSETYSCDKCDYVTGSRTYFLAHKQRHKKTLEQCPVCKRKVKYLNHHLNRGTCVKRKASIPCELCDKVFTDAYHVRRHVKVVHMKIKDIICDMCDYRTHSSFNLKLHRSKMHTKETLEQVCDICQQRTMSLDHHKKTYHLEIYLKEKQVNRNEDILDEVKKLDTNAHELFTAYQT